MTDPSTDHRLLLLDQQDNVLVARAFLHGGTVLAIEGRDVTVNRDVAIGYKVARFYIEPGHVVLKYGAAIGSATHPIRAGERVHTENMKSDYIAIHTNTSDSSHVGSGVSR